MPCLCPGSESRGRREGAMGRTHKARGGHVAHPAQPETLVLVVTLWHDPPPPKLVQPLRAFSAPCRPGGNPWGCPGRV